MAQVINTNIQSLTAQRNLNQTGAALQQSIQRLSSGLRINSAKDDAAGLAISERFTTQIRGLNQAVRNANDGISLAQTGEGGLAEITTNLQRIRELAVQAVNATNSESDRTALNLEVSQRLSEIDRIASQTSFNGRKILDGTFGDATFQVGANVGETIGLTLSSSVRVKEIGQTASSTTVNLTSLVGNESGTSGAFTDAVSQAAAAAAAGQRFALTVGDVAVYEEQQITTTLTSGAFTTAVSSTSDGSKELALTVTDSSGTLDLVRIDDSTDASVTAADIDNALTANATAIAAAGYTISGTAASDDLVISRADGATFTTAYTSTYDTNAGAFATANFIGASETGPQLTVTAAEIDSALALVNDQLVAAGITRTGTAAGGDLAFSRADGEAFDIVLSNNFATAGSFAGGDAFGSGGNLTNGTLTIDNASDLVLSTGELTVQIGDGSVANVTGTFSSVEELLDGVKVAIAGNATATLDSGGNSFTIVAGENLRIGGTQVDTIFATAQQSVDASGSLSTVDVLTAANANDVINRVDSALTSISELRSTFGAIQNRFESVITNLTTVSENLSASRSRILDADFAAETAALTQAQILQQAGIAALSQANAQPQNVLALLQ